MEADLRGHMEKIIDSHLKSQNIQPFIRNVKQLDPLIKSQQDAVFGWLVGILQAGLIAVTLKRYGRTPTKEESVDLEALLLRRAPELMDFIKIEMMK